MAPDPFALETLRRLRLPIDGLYSKNWEEFAKCEAPVMVTAHWGVEDPSLFQGTSEAKSREFIGWPRHTGQTMTILGSISGARFNPAVTLALATVGEFDWREVLPYVLTQIVADFAGVAAAP